MRIIQIIDSLDAGGSERMAVNYANALEQEIEFSGLVVTRKEGELKNQIRTSVSYLFLNKKKQLDIIALYKLHFYVVKNQVTHVHAHSTSFFLAFLLKLTLPSLKIIRHDHYGNNEFLGDRSHLALKFTGFFFNGVIVVNQNLKIWSETLLKAKNVIYLPNFPAKEIDLDGGTLLKGIDGKRIVCLANLRMQKNHFFLLEVAKKIKTSHSDWTFHLIGKDFMDSYSEEVNQQIKTFGLTDNVHLYGSREDITNILRQCDIAVLTSQSEGLPVALLEYGQNKKAVVVTDVGEIPFVVQNRENGMVISRLDADAFYSALVEYIDNTELRMVLGNRLFKTVSENFSEKGVIKKYLIWLKTIK